MGIKRFFLYLIMPLNERSGGAMVKLSTCNAQLSTFKACNTGLASASSISLAAPETAVIRSRECDRPGRRSGLFRNAKEKLRPDRTSLLAAPETGALRSLPCKRSICVSAFVGQKPFVEGWVVVGFSPAIVANAGIDG